MVILDQRAYETVLDHAEADAPLEACGVLVGDRRTETVVETAVRMQNVSASPRVDYRIDPAALLTVFDDTATAGREVVGFYHSHPVGPPTPSAQDRDEARWPGYLYLLVCLAGPWPSLDAWEWTGETFESTPVVVRD